MTQLYGVIGDPIVQSLSPVIHNEWMRTHDLNAVYQAMQVKAGDLDHALSTLQQNGARGLNITMPHKEDALALSETRSDTAKTIGAANTLSRGDDGHWHAENTDVPGFAHSLESLGHDVSGKNVFVLGAGGSARAVALALLRSGAQLTICNRTLARAKALAALFDAPLKTTTLIEGLAQSADADLIINTTGLGHSGGALALPAGKDRLFYDISYGKAAAPSLAAAKQNGWQTQDGLLMLVAQAAFAFQHWFSIFPDIETTQSRCRKLIEATT